MIDFQKNDFFNKGYIINNVNSSFEKIRKTMEVGTFIKEKGSRIYHSYQ